MNTYYQVKNSTGGRLEVEESRFDAALLGLDNIIARLGVSKRIFVLMVSREKVRLNLITISQGRKRACVFVFAAVRFGM